MEYPKNYARTNMRSSQTRITAEISPYTQSARNTEFEVSCACTQNARTKNGCNNDCLYGQSLAMVYSPCQEFKGLYDVSEALCRGTLFSELYKPFCGGRK